MNIAGMHLTDFHKKKLIKDAKYEQKQRQKAIESLSIEGHKIVILLHYCPAIRVNR